MQITKPMENSGFKITEDTQIEYSQIIVFVENTI